MIEVVMGKRKKAVPEEKQQTTLPDGVELEERELSDQEKFLFDLLLSSGSNGRLFVTVGRIAGVERAVICSSPKDDPHNKFIIPIAVVLTEPEMKSMTMSGESAVKVAVDDEGNPAVEAN
jgi:hypothetical protein